MIYFVFITSYFSIYSIQSAVLGPSLAYSWSILSNAAQTGNSIIYFKAWCWYPHVSLTSCIIYKKSDLSVPVSTVAFLAVRKNRTDLSHVRLGLLHGGYALHAIVTLECLTLFSMHDKIKY
jgi:hypothetical protein